MANIATQTAVPDDFGDGGKGLCPKNGAGEPNLKDLLQAHKTALEALDGALVTAQAAIAAGMPVSKKTLTANATTINAAAGSQTMNIGTALPANARIVGVDMRVMTAFSGGTVGDFTVDVGTAGDIDALIDGADLFAAAVDGGPATMPQGVRPNKTFVSAGAQLIATFVCGSDDVGNATAGAVTIDVLYVELA